MSVEIDWTSHDVLFLPTPQAMTIRVGCFMTYRLHCRLYQTGAAAKLRATASETRPRSETRCRDSVKRKVALIIGYDGARYHGLQRNRDVITVSDELEAALHAAGAISDDNKGYLEKIKWQAAARTDRGVCAAGNVISAKLLFRKEEHLAGNALQMMATRVNDCLPGHIRLFGIRNITGSFSARLNCDARWYEYLLPIAALSDRRSVAEFGEILKAFEGTHPFHNYTVGQDHVIPPRRQSMRYLTEVECDQRPIRLQGISDQTSDMAWIRIRVKGQSFMLHQIRKMVSMAVLTHHGRVPHDAIGRSFSRQLLVDVPPAPSLGLFLDYCRFDSYNERHKGSLSEPLTLGDFDSAREEFKMRHIFPSIARRYLEEDPLDIFFKTADAHPPRF